MHGAIRATGLSVASERGYIGRARHLTPALHLHKPARYQQTLQQISAQVAGTPLPSQRDAVGRRE